MTGPKGRNRDKLAGKRERVREGRTKVTATLDGGGCAGPAMTISDEDHSCHVVVPHLATRGGETADLYQKARKADGSLALVFRRTFSDSEWAQYLKIVQLQVG